MLSTISTTETAVSLSNLALGPSLLDQGQTDSSLPRRPQDHNLLHQQPVAAIGNSSVPWLTSPRPSLRFDTGRQKATRPLNEYHHGYGHSHEDEHVAQPRPTPSPTRSATAASFASYLPASIRARLLSPGKLPQWQVEEEDDDDDEGEHGIMGLTGEGRKTRREVAESQSLSGTKTSQPKQAASEACTSPDTTTKGQVRISISESTPADTASKSAASATAPQRLSLLAMFSRPPPAVTDEMHNELLSLKVEEALFPTGTPGTKDPFSPAAFKNLQQQATGLLTKMQTAYRQKAEALVDLQKDREAERDEIAEAEARAKHLKFQLEDMASKATEQERRMKQLMEELAAERRARTELERNLSHLATIMKTTPSQRLSLSPGGFQSEAGSTISEDLGVDAEEALQKRKWRKSNGTDTSFETDDDAMSFAESESVFSRPRSPSASTTTTTARSPSASTTTTTARGVVESATDMVPTPQSMRGPAATSSKRASVASVTSVNTNRRSTQQMSTFQKLMKGISGGEGCPNCKGQDASVAWDTVGALRDENKGLKQRVGELEDCLEGALDAVNGIGL